MDGILNYYGPKKSFENKNIIVTGATGGIGTKLISVLCDLGANVYAICKDETKFLKLFGPLVDTKKLHYEVIDFSDRQIIKESFSKIMLYFYGKLDMMMMCHGKFYIGEISETPVNEFDFGVNINFRSNFALMSLAAPFLKLTKGNVVMISSMEAFIPVKSGMVNCVTKSLVNSLIQNSALELASFGVRVNGVAPGITYTSHRVGVNENFREAQNKLYMEKVGTYNLLNGAVIKPIDIINAMLFLASEDANFITGEILQVDDGYGLNHDLSFSNSSG